MRVVNATRQHVLIQKGDMAEGDWARLRGLIGKSSLRPGEGLVLHYSIQIHTFGMRFPIDVLFLDRIGIAIRLIHRLPPGRVSPLVRASAYVVELPAGLLAQTGTRVGDWIDLFKDGEQVPEDSSDSKQPSGQAT